MISKRTLLGLISAAAESIIPFEDLTDEQRDVLLNMTYRLCNCKICASPYWKDKPNAHALAHINKNTYVISFSKKYFDFYTQQDAPGISLFILIETAVHEILHGLFPDLEEEAVEKKTAEWLNNFNWDFHIPHFARPKHEDW
jgi:hypothetical protein